MKLEINTILLFPQHFSETLNSLGQGPLLPPRSERCEAKRWVLATAEMSGGDTQTAHKIVPQSTQEILNIGSYMAR